MTPSPTRRVLSILLTHRLEFLLMGGQACILYGAAEFSRDLDVAIHISEDNIARLQAALATLDAEVVYFPALSTTALERGHACHFRCRAAGANGMRLDVMARMRGVDSWNALWERRVELELVGVGRVPVMGLSDLVRAKKTQRDKDWPMIRRLVERDVAVASVPATEVQVTFWLMECRTPELLIALASEHRDLVARLASRVDVLAAALAGDEARLRRTLRDEEEIERERDRAYWRPLKAELDSMRHSARMSKRQPGDPSA